MMGLPIQKSINRVCNAPCAYNTKKKKQEFVLNDGRWRAGAEGRRNFRYRRNVRYRHIEGTQNHHWKHHSSRRNSMTGMSGIYAQGTVMTGHLAGLMPVHRCKRLRTQEHQDQRLVNQAASSAGFCKCHNHRLNTTPVFECKTQYYWPATGRKTRLFPQPDCQKTTQEKRIRRQLFTPACYK
ncbi:hypothetical protein DFR30_0973 [Thiogranum longum]|uniref:Uncharacterized protein n=1 Tax=Thiogranum longum TaxID=1537524 RepID=A0A4R1HAV8_9GAMM|nr:hypothetical protein DFR30_0973 [Thiogranum longum]